jgi:hypothetical protein
MGKVRNPSNSVCYTPSSEPPLKPEGSTCILLIEDPFGKTCIMDYLPQLIFGSSGYAYEVIKVQFLGPPSTEKRIMRQR